MNQIKIAFENIGFNYTNSFPLFSNLNLEIKAGAVFCLVGPNGAGKTSLMKLASAKSEPNSGRILIDGNPLKNEISKVLYSYDNPHFYKNMSAYENLRIFCDYNSLDYSLIEPAIAEVGLENSKKKIKAYSLGMIKRLSLALLIIYQPEIIIMDEPFNGLDPEGMKHLKEFILKLNAEGKTFIISSHLLRDVTDIATEFAAIENGKVLEVFSNNYIPEETEKKYFELIKYRL